MPNTITLPYNNSDDELDDFVSFPMIADPVQQNQKSLTHLLTKTIRKVTENAQSLVGKSKQLEREEWSDEEIDTTLRAESKKRRTSGNVGGNFGANSILSRIGELKRLDDFDSIDPHDRLTDSSHYAETSRTAGTFSDIGMYPLTSGGGSNSVYGGNDSENCGIASGRLTDPSNFGTTKSDPRDTRTTGSNVLTNNLTLGSDLISTSTLYGVSANVNSPNGAEINSGNFDAPLNSSRYPASIASKDDTSTPRVTSDNKTLRLSTLIPKDSYSSTSSLININALPLEVKKAPPITKKSLSTKISSIFNNLPNDIELSDDESDNSDTETVNLEPHNSNVSNNDHTAQSNSTPHLYNELSLYSESIVQSSPVKAKPVSGMSKINESSISSFHALKSKSEDQKKRASNIGNIILDNAISVISNNYVSSNSSILTSNNSISVNKKKKKPKNLSENPLKNGGIPKKYWMNDSFVSDCLNCFKPFTAFRRKHHCRFCGQIFCSRCTLFISYSQYKEERKNGGPLKKSFNDKLRVCKPCYSDVIVYLSDDSSSSEEEEEEIEETNQLADVFFKSDNDAKVEEISQVSSRGRSFSINSRYSQSKVGNGQFRSSGSAEIQQSADTLGISLDINTFPKQTPQKMAIPARRKGEAVEIPLTRSSFSNTGLGEKYNSLGHFSHNHYQHVGTPTNTSHPTDSANVTPKTWLKNYNHLISGNMSTPDLSKHPSFENMNNIYSNLIGRKPSLTKFRIQSGSEKDAYRHQKHMSIDRGSAHDTNPNSDESSDTDSDGKENQESENEDEQAMSLYTSLTISGGSKKPARVNQPPSSTSAVPTLREFPNMQNSDAIFPRFPGIASTTFPKMFTKPTAPLMAAQKKQISFLEEHPQSETIRSHERAHASLVRMRSRRKSRTNRNLLIFTQNYRLPSFDKQVSHEIISPSSPNPGNSLYLLEGERSAQSSEKKSSVDSTYDTQSSPIEDRLKLHDLETSQDLADVEDNVEFDVPADTTLEENYELQHYNSSERIYHTLLEKLLIQCLKDCDISEDLDRWVATLKKIFAQIDQLKLTDTLDVRQYVKIKKLAGGRIEDTSIIDGLFITKNIDSKKMASSIKNPKIALLMFPIEYLKQKEQFISLRIIHSQQSVYITNLVSRLVSMEPDIVVVGDTVCGLAKTLLEEAGVTVLSNTKPQIIERISRYTKAYIFQSVNDLFFKKGNLGTCGRFEIKKYRYKNTVKTFSFFTGNDTTAGFTISLRGGDEELLSSVKYAVETMIPGYMNARFEKSLLEDHSIKLSIPTQIAEVDEINGKFFEIQSYEDSNKEEGRVSTVTLDKTEVVNYMKLFNERSLSTSPAVKYSMPTPLMNLINSYYEYHLYSKKNEAIQGLRDVKDVDPSFMNDFQIKYDQFPQVKDLLTYLKFASDDHLDRLTHEYQNRARIWSNCLSYPIYQLYPIFHRQIHVLHSSVSIKHATPCSGPDTVVVDYYTDNDKCLGLFLDQTFQESTKVCPECGDSLLNHFKTYVHGNAKLDVIIEKFDGIEKQDNYPSKDHRVMWSYCKICNHSTPISPMHDETYYLSIGKFLELSFYGENVNVNNSKCEHSFVHNYIRCYGYNDLIIRLEYSPIDNYEVVVPKKQLEFLSELDINLKIDVVNSIKEKSDKLFKSVSNRLERVKVDTYEKAEEGLSRIQELKKKMDLQIIQIQEKTIEIYNAFSPRNYLSLNTVLRDLQKLGVEWDQEFDIFEQKFLPSENEITKITQFHLRSFLLDKYNESDEVKKIKSDGEDHNSDTEIGSEKPDVTESKNSGDSTSNDPIPTRNDSLIASDESTSLVADESNFHVPMLNREKTKELGNMIPSSLYNQSNFLEKMSMWKELAERESTVISGNSKTTGGVTPVLPKRVMSRKHSANSITHNSSTPNLPVLDFSGTTSSKVTQLANFFDKLNLDQISLEFKKQREQELQRKAKNKIMAVPVLESKPMVEIYDNIEEAVVDDKKLKPVESNDAASRRFETETKEVKDGAQSNTVKTLDIPQPEKQSLLKSLTNFWADRSATLWDPLEYPLESHEHTFADSDVIVREDEPSSLVAFCLSNSDYKQKIKIMEQETDRFNTLLDNIENSKKNQNFVKIEKKFKRNQDRTGKVNELEMTLTKNKSNHLKYQFNSGNTNLSCKIFYSEQFEALRKSCGNIDTFIQSLSRCVKWNSKGGKSRSSFLKTLDNRYIIKELSSSELESFVSIAPFYFRYISQSIFNNLSTAIAKIYGFYQIEIKNNTNGRIFKMDFLIMENLFYNHKTTRIFDLKGSMRNRHVQQTGKEDEVLLDENMIEYIYESPVFVKEHSKKMLRGSLFNDTSFLSAMDVMDYSLVVGIDDTSKKLYIGIIDWLRTFTWDKKVENWVKGNNLIGGNRKGKDPTIVTPKQYRTRFREAMERYILEVPDIWYEGSK